jgi:predicted RNase H-like HicB family nuclease
MRFTAAITREGTLYVAQCLEVDVASQGATEDEALSNLREALELHMEDGPSAQAPRIREIEIPSARAS